MADQLNRDWVELGENGWKLKNVGEIYQFTDWQGGANSMSREARRSGGKYSILFLLVEHNIFNIFKRFTFKNTENK